MTKTPLTSVLAIYKYGYHYEVLRDNDANNFIVLDLDNDKFSKYNDLEEIFSEVEGKYPEQINEIELYDITADELKTELDICEPEDEENGKFLYIRELL